MERLGFFDALQTLFLNSHRRTGTLGLGGGGGGGAVTSLPEREV